MPQKISTPENVLYLALELSNSTWLAAAQLPGRDKAVMHRIDAGDTAALLEFVAVQRARAKGSS